MPRSDADSRKPSARGRKSGRGGSARDSASASLHAALRQIRLLLCDVDGVLTDASVFIGGTEEAKQFNILDGLGLVNLRRQGLKVGWISSRPSPATTRRARELKIDFLRQAHGIDFSADAADFTGILAAIGVGIVEID